MSSAAPAPEASTVTATAPAWPGLRIFAGTADEPRSRRASDVIVVVVGIVLLGAISASAVPIPGFVRALGVLLASLPTIVTEVGEVVADTVAVLALATLIAAFVRRRRTVARDIVLAVVLAAVTWLLLGRSVEGEWPTVWRALRDAGPPPWYPAPRIALPGAMLLAALPHLTMPLRRVVWWALAIGTAAVAVAGGATPIGAVAGLLIAMVTASVVLLVFGSSAGRPSLEQVGAALAELGVDIAELGVADRQEAGYFLVTATAPDGSELAVKVYGRDAHDSALLSTVWRAVWYREAGAPARFRRLQQVEYEAFMTLFAGQAGVATDTVVVAGATESDDALLVLRPGGIPLARTDADAAWVVPAVWNLVDRLHRHGITHGQLDARHIIVTGDELLGVSDFRGAAIDRGETRVRVDEVQALVTTALLAGPQTAVTAALDVIGPARLAAALPYLQPPTLTSSQRQHLARNSPLDALDAGESRPSEPRLDELDLGALRTAAAAAAGVAAPELRRLRRVTVGTVLRLALPAIALLVLVSALAGLDIAELIDELGDASWWLVAVGALAAQTPRFTQAISTLGASPAPLPLGPVYALQLAISYINVAIPATAARVAVNVRFFQRHGVPPGTALAAGALDGFGGLIVQAFLLLTLLMFTSMSLDVDLSNASTAAARLAVLVAVIAIGAGAIVVAVRRVRRFVVSWVVRLATEAWTTVRGLRSMRRLALLLGGNLGSEILFASALGVFARALGYPIGLGDLLFINISVGLLSALIPVPGGVGVAEGGLTLGLARAGMPEGVAFAAVLLYRMATFYLPPVWGYAAMRWLERNNHL